MKKNHFHLQPFDRKNNICRSFDGNCQKKSVYLPHGVIPCFNDYNNKQFTLNPSNDKKI